jgi:putative GTP pyrophosphokinase
VSVRFDFDDEYSRAITLLPEFGTTLEGLIESLLKAKEIRVHRVEHRVKTWRSATLKAARKVNAEGEPRPLESFTDLLGLRVITYFKDEVDDVAELIEDEFAIDRDNSVDKRDALDPDRFGYLSVHYVARLGQGRVSMKEYQQYGGIKFEVQIRSILQHAWAEIEHDLGYKSESALPRGLRRRFSRLAGLLELADDEFLGMRQEIKDHQDEASETIEQGELGIDIDQDSLSAFIESSDPIRQLSEEIGRHMNGVVQGRPDREFIGRQAAQLLALGFSTIEDLSDYIDANGRLLERFARERLRLMDHKPRAGRSPVPAGVALHYVGMLKSAQDIQAGQRPIQAYAGLSAESLRLSLRTATEGSEPLPGV